MSSPVLPRPRPQHAFLRFPVKVLFPLPKKWGLQLSSTPALPGLGQGWFESPGYMGWSPRLPACSRGGWLCAHGLGGGLKESQVLAGKNGMRLQRSHGLPVAEQRDLFCGASEKQTGTHPQPCISLYNHNQKLLSLFLLKRKSCISLYLC